MHVPLILFDGICNFCNRSVNFIIDHDPHKRFRFVPLQSELGQSLLRRFGLPQGDVDTMILVDDGRAYARSSAALRVAWRLGGLCIFFTLFFAIPPLLRDGAYNVLASNRYRWFGKTETCRVPTADVRDRFVG